MEPHKHLTNVLDERAGQSCTFNGDDGYLTNVLDERAGQSCTFNGDDGYLTNVLDERAGQSCTFNGTSQTCWTSVLAMEPHKHLTNVLDERAGHGTSQTPHKRVGRACWPVLYI